MNEYKYLGNCDYDNLICPFGCLNYEIKELGLSQTLLGYFGGPENDPNHFSQSCLCLNCNQSFLKEYVPRNKKVWYSKNNYILMGEPGCCASGYLRHCFKCNGRLKHSLANSTRSFNVINGKSIPTQPHFWQCLNCQDIFDDLDYGDKFLTLEKIIEARTIAKETPYNPPELNFTVKEDIGLAVINTKIKKFFIE